MLTDAIGNVLPAAIAVALSPIPIIGVILILATPKARGNGLAFAVGWVAGLVIVSVIVLVVTGGADDTNSATSTGVNWVTLGLGVLFLVMAARQWRSRPKEGQDAQMPTWMQTVDTFDPLKSLALGAALSGANPKNLALTLAATASIAQAGLSTGDTAIAVAVFIAIGSITVVGAVLFYLVATKRATRSLGTVKDFMTQHSAVIMMVVLLVLGAKLIGDGLAGVTN